MRCGPREKCLGQHPGQRHAAVRGSDNIQASSPWRVQLQGLEEMSETVHVYVRVYADAYTYACVRGPISDSDWPP